ncbi:MAG: SDR family NAD(P)-dependent oxidoreductase [Gemmatimonadetes bacterium]|nr:SDR family NAD(P)-dependent oxidoreductase [Gemmatimonadota bacterium]MYE92821.1 SDR family NAD(P)-dependent oxidoreductase [Gemmatimonadota bacterium]MYJ10701.1 SDR family NAD(P)-dependent oxidoreductase [Gemmatimonadota bacterium]
MSPSGPAAIVGYAYRMPGGIRTDSDFWRLLSQREVVREPVTDRYGRGYQPIGDFSGPGRFGSAYEGLIRDEGEQRMDGSLFGVSRNEMAYMDPQIRMLLGCSWESCEHAGWDLNSLRNSPTGVFIGAQVASTANWRALYGTNEFSILSIDASMLANRISYHLNLMGPSIACSTACSASLTALHTAMNSLRQGDCDRALVGAATYLGSARCSASFNALGVISPDGRCHSFDADANGYMRAEGAFVFAIKPLEAAERDGDHIFAVIEATAVNTAGTADDAAGMAQGRYITAPTRHSQVELMRAACARAGLEPGDFDYIEAHATGTVVGDRIEGNAIAEAFGGVEREVPLRVASVKSNVGHLEAAAFSAALLKVVLMMRQRAFAPISRNFLAPNLEIDFDSCPMQVQTVCEPFPDRPVVVGINSFGFGGANGHCVVREYRPERPRVWSVPLAPGAGYMIPLSARTTNALVESARELRRVLDEREIDLYTLAGNLGRRRGQFAARAAFAVRDPDELAEALDAFVDNPDPVSTVEEGEPRVAMVFSGQGTQWAGCGQALYDADPVFRRVVDAVEEEWREHCDVSLRDACFKASQEELNEVQLAQPAIFMIQCALVELLSTWGVQPDCVVGHSSGEVAAAYACGALSLAEATHLVYHRATLQQQVAGSGRMLAIGLDRAGVQDLLDELSVSFRSGNHRPAQVEIACENSPANTVICGKEDALRPVMAELDRRDLQNRLIPGNIAFHSTAMDPLHDDVMASLSFLDDCVFDVDVPMVSSVTGSAAQRLDAAYWWSNIREPVRFAAAMDAVKRDHRPDIVLEIAPHGALQPLIRQCLEGGATVPACIPTLMKDEDVCLGFQEALGALYRSGAELDFASQYPRPKPVAHLLPGHPQEQTTTHDDLVDDEMFVQRGEYSHGPLVGHRVACDHILFESRLSERDFPWMTDHRVHRAPIIPAAGYIELLLQAFAGDPVHIDEIEFLQHTPVGKTPVRLQTALFPVPNAPDQFTFTISTRSFENDDEGTLHCRGRVRRVDQDYAIDTLPTLDDVLASDFDPQPLSTGEEFYDHIEAVVGDAFEFGPEFRSVRQIEMDSGSTDLLLDIEVDDELWASGREEGYLLYPPLTDGGLQIFLRYLMRLPDFFSMPQRACDITFLRPPTGPRISCFLVDTGDWFDVDERGQYNKPLGELYIGRLSFYDRATGKLIAHIGEYHSFNSNPRWSDVPDSKHLIRWQPKFVPPTPPVGDAIRRGEVDPAALIAALEDGALGEHYACHVIEIAGRHESARAILNQCLEHLSGPDAQTEYWLVGEDEEATRALYDAFNHHDAALRFDTLDLMDSQAHPPDLAKGLLRPAAAELVLLHGEAGDFGPDQWTLVHRLMVAGGLAVVCHKEGDVIEPGGGWTTLHAGSRTTLLQAPDTPAGLRDATEVEDAERAGDAAEAVAGADPIEGTATRGPRWVIGEPDTPARAWIQHLDSPMVHHIPWKTFEAGDFVRLEEWPGTAELEAIDLFVGADPGDPTGERIVWRFVAFLQALAPLRLESATRECRLTVITRGAACGVDDPRGSALWGAVRSIALELLAEDTRIDFRLVDIGAEEDLEALAEIVRCDPRERELAIREQRPWVPRIVSVRQRAPLVPEGDDPPYRLRLDNPGQVSGLQMTTCEPPALGPADVEVQVAAAALNFRDVMVTLGLLPAMAYERSALGREVGIEASGVVRRAGSEVKRLKVGDEVALTAGGCIANRVVVNEHLAFLKPPRLSMEEAASALSVCVTAYYSLIHLARLREGQRVLIHSAMGGVGQAAIALARHVGAEIYATAGNESKREQLLAMGVRGAFDSHSHSWYDDLMEATGGEGVDVVLNSLAGHHIALCLKALRPSGWHCEIGKVDIYTDNALSMRVFRKNLRFAAIDVDRLMLDDPVLSHVLSQACLDLMAEGAVTPPPLTVFPYRDYAQALRLMTTGQHQGKLVLQAPEDAMDRGFGIADTRPFLDPDATYLVTGGLGGFGLRFVPYLIAAGARHLTLMDRDPTQSRDVEWIRQITTLSKMPQEYEIDIVPGDVRDEADVQRCIGPLRKPLKGVFHLAGTLEDRSFLDTSPDSLARVFAPKAQGALNLHHATAGCDLDYFVLFSSIASTFGNMGQINYSGASAFLDGLAEYRRQRGLPGFAYNLGPVTEVGMAARSLHVMRMMRAAGMTTVSANFAIANLDYALRTMADRDHVVTALFSNPPWSVESADYMRNGRLVHNQAAFEVELGSDLTIEGVVAQISAKVAELCGHEEGDMTEPLASFGLTSISVAELGAFIQTQYNHQVSALELMTTATALSLAQSIVEGTASDDEAVTVAENDGSAAAAEQFGQRTTRRSSPFANRLADHFPKGEPAPVPGFDGSARRVLSSTVSNAGSVAGD